MWLSSSTTTGTVRIKSNNTKPSKRLYRLRDVPWKLSGMARLSLLLFSANQVGALAVQNKARGIELIKSNHEGAIIYTSTAISTDITHRKSNSTPTEVRFDTDSYRIKIDNCCTRSITPSIDDFIGPVTTVQGKAIRGFGGTTSRIKHTGTVRWVIDDDDGKSHEILIPNTYHVPSAPSRLLSPQHWAQEMNDNVPNPNGTWCGTYANNIVLNWKQCTFKKTITLDAEAQNVATMWSSSGFDKYTTTNITNDAVCFDANVISDEEDGYDPDDEEEEPIEMHEPADAIHNKGIRDSAIQTDFNLNSESQDLRPTTVEPDTDDYGVDASALMLRWHAKLSHISMKRIQQMSKRGQLPLQLLKCRVPTCASCIYGKLTRRKWRSKLPLNANKINTITMPGQCVSVDQLESSTLGLVAQLKGRLTNARYRCATIFVDHYSDLSYVHLQQSTSAIHTLEAKAAFESYARSFGVQILHYHGDNGRFAENAWRQDCLLKHQKLTFCGVSAHHQNGRAEKKIRDAQDLARTSLLHAARRWPDAINSHLWPYALRQAVESLNKSTRLQTKLSPLEMFSGVSVLPSIDQDHTFGCPAFALDGKLQDGKKIDKWDNRARLAIYIGHSPQHAQTVGLLLSLTTGLVSPQFHVKYDDLFETVRTDKKLKVLPKSMWQTLSGFKLIDEQLPKEQVPKEVDPEGASLPPGPTIDDETPNIPPTELIDQGDIPPTDMQPADPPPTNQQRRPPREKPTRSGRISRPPAHFDDYVVAGEAMSSEVCYLITDLQSEHRDPLAYATSTDPDVMHLHEAMKQHDRVQFVAAMVAEIRAHTENGNWVIILRSAVPAGHQVLPAIWAMRCKRRIDTREVYKWKARLNIHGGKQTKGLNYWDTYAPVATWPSIRLIINVATQLSWHIRQLDFVLAFPQAPVETDLYMEIPRGFVIPSEDKAMYVLKLVNNLYGQKQAGRVWYKYLSAGLCNKLGFRQSEYDPCVFWRKSTILVIYTDDTIVVGPKLMEIEAAIADIAKEFVITTAPSVSDFLGVKISKSENAKSYEMTQPQLIDSILQDLSLGENSKTRDTPALSSVIIQQHADSQPHNEEWHYRSVIGKLNYLEKCTRPDIAYAVHQCARFAHDPKVEHSKAVKHIGRYLLGTKDKGIVCKPNGDSFNCFADADFAGQWERTIAELDASTARSRSGYIIFHNGCPVIWASRLQTEIALSSTESEYVALSQALREVLPMMRLAQELANAKVPVAVNTPKIHCKAFEDNSGALEMARTPKMRPRTKHMNIKYHHFRVEN